MAIKAIIGLGNPGKEYVHTYHNIGEWCLSFLESLAVSEMKSQYLFVHPKGFMNTSGIFVKKELKNYNLQVDELLIIHDDSDLPIGKYKLIRGGGSAGHNGINSIIENLGTPDFWRLRIGIRDPQEEVRKKASDFVLQRFPDSTESILKEQMQSAWSEIQKLK
jgi:PTH1 family peptidyl-tRNA hydrolase